MSGLSSRATTALRSGSSAPINSQLAASGSQVRMMTLCVSGEVESAAIAGDKKKGEVALALGQGYFFFGLFGWLGRLRFGGTGSSSGTL